jgi:hypothetical protein
MSAWEAIQMYERFTDGARAAVKSAFCRQTTVCERDILIALNGSRGVAQLLMVTVGDVAGRLPNGGAMVEKRALVEGAVAEARQRGLPYVGTEHILLAVARLPGSALTSAGATAEQLDALLSAHEANWRQAHPPLSRRIGAACRTAIRWLGGA